ncbi:MAG: hypothetical protein BMS9Abin36_1244 [Gammaproteobacteria bacterium]|nr:MAG: hypothetical protein BMS9Abin36_1244 [Gammaproteobacteria bacterium]
MSLDAALQKAISAIPECVAAGYVDLSTGMLLGVKTVDSHPQEVLEVVAAATADLFQGTNVVTIESLFKKARGVADDGHHYFQEMMIMSDNLLHLFMRGKGNEEHVVCFVCRKSVNMGMALTKARGVLPEIEASV